MSKKQRAYYSTTSNMIMKHKTIAATKLIVASIVASGTRTSANAIVPTAAPTDWPTYWPTYSPTPDEALLTSLRCPSSFESFVQIDETASMQYSIVQSENPLQSGIFCGRLFVDGVDDGWVAIAFSKDGHMPGSDAIVANLEEESVLKYHLGGRSPSGVVLMEESKQTLKNTYVGVYGNMTVVEFTKLLIEDGEVTINGDGTNILLHARGDTWPGYHSSRTVFADVGEKERAIASVCDETRPCPDGEYCKLEPGRCLDESETHEGVCVRIHDNCNWPVAYLPVCGCDGETYGNECEVDEIGTSVAYNGRCELDMRQGDLSQSNPDLPCPENQCRDPDGECRDVTNCFADPCDVQNECAYAECEANYCGGCHHVCNINGNGTKVDISDAGFQPEEISCSPGGVCSTEGSSCSVGNETCCGETFPSLTCDCMGGSWMCINTDACMFPSCCRSGPPENQPPPSPGTCSGGLLCDTGVPDDYCCNDFTNPDSTYCTISGGMPQTVTTEAPVTTTIDPPVSDSPTPAASSGAPTSAPIYQTTSTAATSVSTTSESALQTTSTAATSVSTTSETASTSLPETTVQSTTAFQTSTAISVTTTDNPPPVNSTTSTVQTESTGETSSTAAPPTQPETFEFDLDFSTTTTVPTTTNSDLELTTKPTQGTVEGRPGSLTSTAEKSFISLFSLSLMSLALALQGI